MILTAATIAPQVGGHRLVERQQREAAVVDLDVELVDRLVAAHHLVDERRVPRDQPAHGRAHPLLGQAAHLEQPRLERLELLLEMSYTARSMTYPNRPVT